MIGSGIPLSAISQLGIYPARKRHETRAVFRSRNACPTSAAPDRQTAPGGHLVPLEDLHVCTEHRCEEEVPYLVSSFTTPALPCNGLATKP
jgi:hypothetical protein